MRACKCLACHNDAFEKWAEWPQASAREGRRPALRIAACAARAAPGVFLPARTLWNFSHTHGDCVVVPRAFSRVDHEQPSYAVSLSYRTGRG